MKGQDIVVTVIEPDTFDEIIDRYTKAVAQVIKNKLPLEQVDTFLEKLKKE